MHQRSLGGRQLLTMQTAPAQRCANLLKPPGENLVSGTKRAGQLVLHKTKTGQRSESRKKEIDIENGLGIPIEIPNIYREFDFMVGRYKR
ncbi:hypothetical protein EVAR_79490_1 [Eumeta japonica]|uniref:Uncharacterized protein n=1 Tax=Eumeta variegata TaxID=151549 RepID=A0A4C1UDQ5_EUMVA|nr:hypothetical protein EVAR_79490_1 [Eumeta japonica]